MYWIQQQIDNYQMMITTQFKKQRLVTTMPKNNYHKIFVSTKQVLPLSLSKTSL